MATTYLYPNGAGNYNDFSVSGAPYIWQALDDPAGSPDTTTTGTAPLVPSYQSVRLGEYQAGCVISQISISIYARSPGATSTGRIFLRIGGANYESGDLTIPTSYGTLSNIWLTNPATGGNWTPADLFALEAGLRITEVHSTSILLSQLYATVTYTAPATFAVNGTAFYGVIASWQRQRKRRLTNGTIEWQNYALHTWEIAQMEMANYLALQAQHGQRLTSLATVDIDDCRVGATYTNAEIINLSGEQVGQRMTGVQVQFRADVS